MDNKNEEDRILTPSERSEKQSQTEAERVRIIQARESALREDFTRTFQTESGKRVLAWFKERSGFAIPSLAADKEGNIDPLKTTFNAMELNMYLAIRRYIPTNILMEVEYGTIRASGTVERVDDPTSSKRRTSKSTSGKRSQ